VATPGGHPSTLDAPPILLQSLEPSAQFAAPLRVEFDRAARMKQAARRSCENLHQVVKQTLSRGELPLILGGECTLIAGSLSAAVERLEPLALAFFDAHADFNTAQTTPSGYLGGMCLAHVCGLFAEALPWLAPSAFSGKNVSLIGGRALDPGEVENLARAGVNRIAPEAPDAPDRIRDSVRGKSVWIHVDLDLVDPAFMFAVSHPTPKGIAFDRLSELLSAVATTATVQGMEVCGYQPAKDPERLLPTRIAAAVAETLSLVRGRTLPER